MELGVADVNTADVAAGVALGVVTAGVGDALGAAAEAALDARTDELAIAEDALPCAAGGVDDG